jgi:hypothetical protein
MVWLLFLVGASSTACAPRVASPEGPVASAASPTETRTTARATASAIPIPPTASATVMPAATAPATPTRTASPTVTTSPTAIPTTSPTATPTATPFPTSTPSATPSATPEPPPPPTASPIPPIAFPPPPGRAFADLNAFWDGAAEWVLEVPDTGLPGGESDTVYRGGNEFWSYLHSSHASAGVVDQCGNPVPFPGCTTLWKSTDGGKTFRLENPVCLLPCAACPCENSRDHVAQQQYPRVFLQPDQAYLVYEFGAYVYLRTSTDGLHWSGPAHVPGTGVWYHENAPCEGAEAVGDHPHIYRELEYDCLAGGPPGIYVEGNQLYVFLALGRAPGHMGCLVGERFSAAWGMRKCAANPLFGADLGYGPVEQLGAQANPYFEFRTISSADVVRVDERYYMTYEGVRGPSNPSVVDDQFGLGLARSAGPFIDGPWERYPGNPILMDLPGNVGVGHADLVLAGGATYLYTATPGFTRGRYVLVQR